MNSQKANRSKIDLVDLELRESAVINILSHENNSSLASLNSFKLNLGYDD